MKGLWPLQDARIDHVGELLAGRLDMQTAYNDLLLTMFDAPSTWGWQTGRLCLHIQVPMGQATRSETATPR
jgi:hypothetical protein